MNSMNILGVSAEVGGVVNFVFKENSSDFIADNVGGLKFTS